jgi:hypothetical protein
MTNLTLLDLGRNQLSALPAGLAKMSKLKVLRLSHNKFTTLPESVCELQRLTDLYIDDNQIQVLPNGIGKLRKLQTFNAARNPIGHLPPAIGTLPLLRHINLNGCPLLPPPHHSINRFPSLLELSARAVLQQSPPSLTPSHPPLLHDRPWRSFSHPDLNHQLTALLSSAQMCAHCAGPLVQTAFFRGRYVVRSGVSVPLKYVLCSDHWTYDDRRISLLFTPRKKLSPPSDNKNAISFKEALEL